MKKAIGLILLAAGIYLGYLGIEKYNKSGESVDILGAELAVENKDGRTTSYLYMGFSVVGVVGGIVLLAKGK